MTRGFSVFIGWLVRIIYQNQSIQEGNIVDKNLIDEILRDIGLEHIEDDDR
jgi:uncharacterized protein (DUF2342 family)